RGRGDHCRAHPAARHRHARGGGAGHRREGHRARRGGSRTPERASARPRDRHRSHPGRARRDGRVRRARLRRSSAVDLRVTPTTTDEFRSGTGRSVNAVRCFMSRASRLLLPWICVCSASACADDDPESTPLPEAIVATVSPTMPTVVHVTWTTARPATGVVRYGTGGALTHATPASVTPSTEHRHTLLGLRADTDYTFQVVVDEDATSEPQIVRTGPLPTGTPQFVVEGTGHDGFVVVPMIGAATRVVILDAEGHIVWSREVTNEHDVYRARLSVDGASILYNAATVSGDPTADTRLVRVALDGSAETSIPMPLLAHDFVEHPDGTIGAIVVEYRDVDGVSVRGDQIVEVEPTGEVTPVWSAWDCFDPADETGDDIEHGWTFANAIDYDPVERVYYLGMRNFSSIAK